MIVTVLIVAGAILVTALAGLGVSLLLRWLEARGEDASYGLTVNAADAEPLGYGEMSPEIAHEPPAWTSPAAPPPPRAPVRERPGAAAAAHVDPNPPGSVPPPLPDPALAAEKPWAVPFTAWESDTFVGAILALRPPLSAPSDYLHEMEDPP